MSLQDTTHGVNTLLKDFLKDCTFSSQSNCHMKTLMLVSVYVFIVYLLLKFNHNAHKGPIKKLENENEPVKEVDAEIPFLFGAN